MSNIKTFGDLVQAFNSHRGGKPGAHPDADDLVGGFMSAEAFRQHQQLFKTRTFITDDKGVDIFSLEPGFYTSNRFKNGPTASAANNYIDQWQAQLDITQGYSGSRIYRYTVSNNGDTWTCTTHFGNRFEDGSMVWLHEQQKALLWTGDTKLATPLKLTGNSAIARDGSWFYKGFEIEGHDSFGQVFKAESKSSRSVAIMTNHIDSTGVGFQIENAAVDFNSDSTVSLSVDSVIKLVPTNIGGTAGVAVARRGETALSINNIWGIK